MKYYLMIIVCLNMTACTSKYIIDKNTTANDYQEYANNLAGRSGTIYLTNQQNRTVTITKLEKDSITWIASDSSINQIAVQNIHFLLYKDHWRGGLDIFLIGAGLGAAVGLVSAVSDENSNSMSAVLVAIPGVIFGVLAAPFGFLAGHSYEYYFKYQMDKEAESGG